MNKFIYVFLCSITFFSCIYKAGNRQPDINYNWEINVSPFYVKKYMQTMDLSYAKENPTTAEMDNYPENFIPVIDRILGYKYVIEFNNMDSINSLKLNYLGLASIYDFKKEHWIKNIDSLKNNELVNFKKFFSDSILINVVRKYKNKIPDSLLFVGKPAKIIMRPLL